MVVLNDTIEEEDFYIYYTDEVTVSGVDSSNSIGINI